jgi:hypothetical protein
MGEYRDPIMPFNAAQMREAEDICLLKRDVIAHSLQEPPARKILGFITEEEIVGRFTRQALTRGCSVKQAVAAHTSKLIQIGCGRRLKGGLMIKLPVSAIPQAVQKDENRFHVKTHQ